MDCDGGLDVRGDSDGDLDIKGTPVRKVEIELIFL